jgi:hypothetical protein
MTINRAWEIIGQYLYIAAILAIAGPLTIAAIGALFMAIAFALVLATPLLLGLIARQHVLAGRL